MIANQNPEQLVRDQIDRMLQASGWQVQYKKQINLAASPGVAIREYQTNVGPADYLLFVNQKPIGVIEAKREEEAARAVEGGRLKVEGENPDASPQALLSTVNQKLSTLVDNATAIFNDCELCNYVIDVRKKYDQYIDHINLDEITNIGWVKDNKAAAESLVHDFKLWIEQHKTEITAFQIFYGSRRELSYKMIRDLAEAIKTNKSALAPLYVWRAYKQLENVNDSTIVYS